MPPPAHTPRGVKIDSEEVAGLILRLLLWSIAFWAAGWVGGLTRPEGSIFSLIWPPAGVVAIWALTGSRRTWAFDAAALIAIVTAMFLGDFPAAQIVLSSAAYLLEGAAVVWLVRHLTPKLSWSGGASPTDLREIFSLIGIALVAGTLQAVPVSMGGYLTQGTDLALDIPLRTARNSATIFVFLIVGSVVAEAISRARRNGRPLRTSTIAERPWEFVAFLLVSYGVLAFAFTVIPTAPMSFLFLLPTAWGGLRFGKVVATLDGLATGSIVLIFTLLGRGLFAEIHHEAKMAVIAQIFLTAAVLTGVVSAVISDQLRDERAQSQARAAELATLISVLNEGLHVTTEGGHVELTNPALNDLLGKDITGMKVPVGPTDEFTLLDLDGARLPPERYPLTMAFLGEQVRNYYVVLDDATQPDNKVLSYNATLMPRIHPSLPRKVVSTVRDVTLEQRHYESMASFAGVVAHDLKSPLTVIEGWADTLEEELTANGSVNAETGLPIINRITGASTRMRGFINDLLDYTVSKDRPLALATINLDTMADEVIRELNDAYASTVAPPNGLPRPAPPHVDRGELRSAYGDPVLVRQVLANLISNAAKYVPIGISPEIHVSAQPLASGLTEISVTDNGLGVPIDQRNLIFESFTRIHPGYTGTGLGLAICAQIVRRHGGTIAVEPNPTGRGSVFTFTLPSTEAAFGGDAKD